MIETLASLASRFDGERLWRDPPAGGALAQHRYGSIEDPRTPFSAIYDFIEAKGGGPTWSGAVVSPDSAMTISAVYACVRIISCGVAMLDLLTYRRDGDRDLLATDHYLWRLLKDRANPRMSSFRFKRLMTSWVLLHGNAYAVMDVSANGRVTSLEPVHPRRVRMVEGGYMVKSIDGTGQELPVPWEYMLHLRGAEVDERGMGLSVIAQARQSLGAALATEEFAARLFSNGAQFKGFFKIPQALGDDAKKKLTEYIQRRHQGADKAHNFGVLDAGTDFVPTSMSAEDAQFLETRKFQVTDIARWFGVPPHMIGDLDRSTNNNIEHQGIEMRIYCLGPHLESWETEINNSLLSETESRQFFVRFDREELMKGDQKSEAAADSIYRQNGIKTTNEIRKRIGMNPHPDGDTLLANGTLRPVSVLSNPIPPAPEPVPKEGAANA